MTASIPLTSIAKDPQKGRRFLKDMRVTRHMEIWSAVSVDGVWAYERDDLPGTPWSILHVPTGRWTYGYGTLRAARAATASGEALRSIEAAERRAQGIEEPPAPGPAPQIWIV